MKRGRRCVPPGPNTQEDSGPDQRAWHLHAGGVPRWLHPHTPPPAPLSAPCTVPSLRPASCPATSLSGCFAALPAHSQPSGHQEAEAGQPGVRPCSLAAPGLKFASSPERSSGRYTPPAAPSRILTPALLHWGTELRPGQLQGGDAATELKVGTSRAAPWRDPDPTSGTAGSARGRGPGAFCGCLGSRERPPGGEGCAHATAVWSSPGFSRGVPGTQSALSGGAPESILTLHAGFLGSPGRSSIAGSSFTCWFTVCRHGMQHPHQWASLSHSLIMNTARVYGLPTWSVLGPWQGPGYS